MILEELCYTFPLKRKHLLHARTYYYIWKWHQSKFQVDDVYGIQNHSFFGYILERIRSEYFCVYVFMTDGMGMNIYLIYGNFMETQRYMYMWNSCVIITFL